MTTFLIILGTIVYLFIGGIVSGFLTDDYDRDVCDCMFLTFLWPLIAACVLALLIALAPIKIGEKIRERIDKN